MDIIIVDDDNIEDIQCVLCNRNFKDNDNPENIDNICSICRYEKPIVNSRKLMMQKYLFVFLVLWTNAFLGFLWFRFISLYWVIIIIIPRVRDICLVIYILFYNLVSCNCFCFKNKPENQNKPSNICINIFCYCERFDLITRNLNAIMENYKNGNDKYIIGIVLDGGIIGKRNDESLFKMFKKFDEFSEFTFYDQVKHKSWILKDNVINYATCIYREEIPIILIEKGTNTGKKDSIFLLHKIFANVNNFPNTNRPLFYNVNKFLSSKGINHLDYSFKTDADSYINPNSIGLLKEKIEQDENIDAVCGFMRIEYKKNKPKIFQFWNILQDFQFFGGQILRRTAESDLNGKIICIPGPIGFYRLHKHHNDVMEKYVRLPKKNRLFPYLNAFIGTDRRLTNLILSDYFGSKIRFQGKANGYTDPPQNFQTYISQRVRWGTNLITNSLVIISANSNIPWYTRLNSAIDLFRTLTVYFRILFSVWFIYTLITESKIFTITFILMYLIPTSYIFCRLLREKMFFYLLLGWILNKALYIFFYTYIVTKILIGLGNIKWGKTQKVKKSNIDPDENLQLDIELYPVQPVDLEVQSEDKNIF